MLSKPRGGLDRDHDTGLPKGANHFFAEVADPKGANRSQPRCQPLFAKVPTTFWPGRLSRRVGPCVSLEGRVAVHGSCIVRAWFVQRCCAAKETTMAGILRRREGQPNENREMTRQTQGADPFQWLTSWDPFRTFGTIDPLRRMREMLNVDPFAEMPSGFPAMARRFVPDMEVCEKNDCYIVNADLPGLADDDLNVEVTGNRLTISGKREEEHRDEGEKYWAYERSFGNFTRSFVLPEGTLPDQVEARLENGVLEVRIPKTKGEESKRIPVKSSGTGQMPSRGQPSGMRPQSQGGTTSSAGQGTTQTGTMGSTGQESVQGGAREKAA